MANLRTVVSNDSPIREKNFPRTWFLYQHNDAVEIHVRHDSRNRPFVLDKGVA